MLTGEDLLVSCVDKKLNRRSDGLTNLVLTRRPSSLKPYLVKFYFMYVISFVTYRCFVVHYKSWSVQ